MAKAAAAQAIIQALPIEQMYNGIVGCGMCVETACSRVNLVDKKSNLSWAAAERAMRDFVAKDPKNRVADYTKWFGAGYTVRFYVAKGVVAFKSYGGSHDIVINGADFQHKTRIVK